MNHTIAHSSEYPVAAAGYIQIHGLSFAIAIISTVDQVEKGLKEWRIFSYTREVYMSDHPSGAGSPPLDGTHHIRDSSSSFRASSDTLF